MSRTFVHAGNRRTITPAAAHSAGDLVYQDGFFGVAQDDLVTTKIGMIVLEGVQELKNVFGTNILPGTKIFAAPSVIATSLLLYPAASVPSGGVAIGRAWATSPASSASATLKVQLFNPNNY